MITRYMYQEHTPDHTVSGNCVFEITHATIIRPEKNWRSEPFELEVHLLVERSKAAPQVVQQWMVANVNTFISSFNCFQAVKKVLKSS